MRTFAYKLLLSYFFVGIFTSLHAQKDSVSPHETWTIFSQHLQEWRTINVWIPPQANQHPLPVLYLLDGGVQEDFPHIAHTVAHLIAENKISPLYLIGIENTQRRRDFTGFTTMEKDKAIAPEVGGSIPFRNFLKDELFEAVEKRYNTASKSIIGESLAGLFILETFLQMPEMFDYFIAFDPSLWWNNYYLVQNASTLLKPLAQQKKLFFASSQAKSIKTSTHRFANILKKHPVPNLTWKYVFAPKEKHATIFKATKEEGLIWAFQP